MLNQSRLQFIVKHPALQIYVKRHNKHVEFVNDDLLINL